jgi:hypothetical protein
MTVGHEGSHVADAEDWAQAGFTDAARPTNFQTEFRAYGVTSAFADALGTRALSASHGGETHYFWNKWYPQAMNNAMTTNMIKNFYPNWALKAWQLNTAGGNH